MTDLLIGYLIVGAVLMFIYPVGWYTYLSVKKMKRVDGVLGDGSPAWKFVALWVLSTLMFWPIWPAILVSWWRHHR